MGSHQSLAQSYTRPIPVQFSSYQKTKIKLIINNIEMMYLLNNYMARIRLDLI